MGPPQPPPYVPPPPESYTAAGSITSNNALVTSTTDPIIRHTDNPQEHEITWNIAHLPEVDGQPPFFDVTVTIFNLSGEVVWTSPQGMTQEGTGGGSWTWPGTSTIPMPGPADVGIYTFQVHAMHTIPEGCSDQDRVGAVRNPGISFLRWENASETLGTVTFSYTVDEQLSGAQVTVYNPSFTAITTKAVSGLVGTHEETVTFTPEFDPDDPRLPKHYFALTALQSDGSANRDQNSKPVCLRGSVLPLNHPWSRYAYKYGPDLLLDPGHAATGGTFKPSVVWSEAEWETYQKGTFVFHWYPGGFPFGEKGKILVQWVTGEPLLAPDDGTHGAPHHGYEIKSSMVQSHLLPINVRDNWVLPEWWAWFDAQLKAIVRDDSIVRYFEVDGSKTSKDYNYLTNNCAHFATTISGLCHVHQQPVAWLDCLEGSHDDGGNYYSRHRYCSGGEDFQHIRDDDDTEDCPYCAE